MHAQWTLTENLNFVSLSYAKELEDAKVGLK